MVVLKLCGGRGVYEGRKLAEFHDPHPRHRLPFAAVSAKKRSRGEIQIFGVLCVALAPTLPWATAAATPQSDGSGSLPKVYAH